MGFVRRKCDSESELYEYAVGALARRMRTNGISAWGRRAYEDEVVARPFFGRKSVLVNAPEGIRRVLVDNHEAYERTKASVRLLVVYFGRSDQILYLQRLLIVG